MFSLSPCHREQDALLPFEDRVYSAIDFNPLVIARLLPARLLPVGRERIGIFFFCRELVRALEPSPQFIGCWKGAECTFHTRDEIVFHDPFAVCRVGELHPQHFRVKERLLQTFRGMSIFRFRLHHRNRDVLPDEQNVVGTQAILARAAVAARHDPAGRQGQPLSDEIVFPSGRFQFGKT